MKNRGDHLRASGFSCEGAAAMKLVHQLIKKQGLKCEM